MKQLPPGFVVDSAPANRQDSVALKPASIPAGFVIDSKSDSASKIPPPPVIEEETGGGFYEGYGGAFANIGTGALQRILEGYQALGGTGSEELLADTRAVAEELQRRQANLTTGGKIGKFAGDVVQTLAVPGGSTLPRAMALAGGTGATQSFLQPESRDVSPEESLRTKALEAGVTGAVGAAAVPVLQQAGKVVARTGKSLYNKVAKSNISDDVAKSIAKESPVVAESVKQQSDDVATLVSENIDKGLTPDQALLKAKADAYNIRVSKGDVTGDLLQQSKEESALKGLFGEPSQLETRAFREGQVADIQAAAQRAGTKISGELPETIQDVGERVLSAVKTGAKSAKATAQAAYSKADLGSARADLGGIKAYRDALKSELGKEAFSKDLTPTAHHVYEKLNNFIKTAGKKKIKTVNLQHIEGFRKMINNAGKGSNPADGRMLSIMRDGLDNSIDDAMERGLIKGNQSALADIKKARELWKSYKQRYYGRDGKAILGKIVEKDMTPESVMGVLIGTGKLGSKTEAANAIAQLKNVLGKDSAEYGLLKGEAFKRLVGDQLSGKTFSGAKFYNNVRDFTVRNKSLADELFSADELAQITDLAKIARDITTKQEGVVNYSNSGNVILRNIQALGNKFGAVGNYTAAAVTKPIESISKRAQRAEVQRALSGNAADIADATTANPLSDAIASKLGIATGRVVTEQLKESEVETQRDKEALTKKIKNLKIINPYE